MPARLGLHELHALSLQRMRDDADRPLAREVRLEAAQQDRERGHVMAVHLMHLPAEGAPFVRKRLDAHHLLDLAVELKAVAVDDGDEIASLVMGGGHGGGPDLTFLHLAVAEENVDIEVELLPPSAADHAEPGRERVPDRARAEIDTGEIG